jgi:predicted O-methyltransferase YrrM
VYSSLKLAARYLNYYFTASNGKGHGTHSPFVFDFITQVLNNRNHYYAYDSVEALREKLKLNKEIIQVEDMGAGSGSTKSNTRSIASIAKHAAKPKKYGQLLFRIVNHYQPSTILELGTSLGITTSYLALGNQQANLVTIEGSKTIAEKALENFAYLGVNNVKLIQGNFDRILPKTVEALAQIDMAFVDGNHRKQPTLDYFEQLLPVMTESSVMVFDDIHWSADMEEAWEQIRGDKRVMLSIDLFFLGLIFFNPAFKVKQHFTIRF